MLKIKDNVMDIITNWWANRIVKTKHDNGAYDLTNLMANTLADMGVEELTTKQINNFKKDLAEEINKEYNEFPNSNQYLGCDYSPCRALSIAAEKNNIPVLNFPFKVSMWYSNDYVKVRNGYGAKCEILYATRNYYLDEIESLKKYLKSYQNREYKWLTKKEEQLEIERLNAEIKKYEDLIEKVEN